MITKNASNFGLISAVSFGFTFLGSRRVFATKSKIYIHIQHELM